MEDYCDLNLIFEDFIPVDCFNILGEPPRPSKILYGINEQYFRTVDDLIEYCDKMMFSIDYVRNCSFKVIYLNRYGGYDDVFLKTYSKNLFNPLKNSFSLLLTVIDRDGYGVYNYKDSLLFRDNVWTYVKGSLRSLHDAFKHKGVNYRNDIYYKTDVRNELVYKKLYRR